MPKRPLSEPIPSSQGKSQVGRSRRVASTSTCSRRDVLPFSSGFSREPTTAPSTTPSTQHGHNRPESDRRQQPTQGPASPAAAAAPTGKSRRKRVYSDMGKKITQTSSGTTNVGNMASGVGSSERPSKLSGHSKVPKCPRAGDVGGSWAGPSSTDQKSTSRTASLQICQVNGSDKAEANKKPQAAQKRKMGSSDKGTSNQNTSTANPSIMKKRRSEPSTEKTPREPSDPTLPQATFESRYTVGEMLGKGGYGCVYAGTRKSDGLPVAIKVVARARALKYITMPADGVSLPLEVALMRIVSAPECPNIAKLLEWFEGPIVFIFVLERPVPCMDLLNYCRRLPSRLSENQAKHIMRQVVLAAKHCRDRGVLHRDIKPENLLVNTDDVTIKLIDFGCGDLLKESPYDTFAGTNAFIPPEWWLQKSYQGRPATVWSLGVLLYNLLCGKLPFAGEGEVVSGHLQFSRGLSCECRNLIHWCLRKDPTKRPVLEEILQHKWFSTE
ncbi:LOW QUALITY PROTEIN: serine/threonine-protein kinase pim-1-like [Alosa alosa]|uniref:LOW QUALITY PROTEIN: serine/threonine-protein kinase pim-1-like n=1 Tax=Alosa alosa TaxID=278164 RepID=UPI0020151289|nr:LOW QUALITY PROTEIN: serine/threonine-protein kinase pim-1-like [Alosa alosa]